MLPLDSPRWAELNSSCGGDGHLALRLIQGICSGAAEGFAELSEQCCHQLGLGSVAYAAVPYLVEIARSLPLRRRIEPLAIVGLVAACRAAFPSSAPPIPNGLGGAYAESQRAALSLAAQAIGEEGWRPAESNTLLAVLGALHGRCDLAIHLYLGCNRDGGLSCPECGEYIRWSEQPDGLSIAEADHSSK
jgi:hypothetical protein